jgi:hypothetical protein
VPAIPRGGRPQLGQSRVSQFPSKPRGDGSPENESATLSIGGPANSVSPVALRPSLARGLPFRCSLIPHWRTVSPEVNRQIDLGTEVAAVQYPGDTTRRSGSPG